MVCEALRKKNHNAILMDVYFGLEDIDIFEKSASEYDVESVKKNIQSLSDKVSEDRRSFFGNNVIEICQKADIVFMALHGNLDCYCTIGQVGNTQHMNEMSGKAGRTRWMGVRPTVRGMTMNPVDHPNGGGEGKSKSGGGRQHLKSPWGHVKGQKTRRLRKPSDSVIVQRRNAK